MPKSFKPWSDNPNAPQITSGTHLSEKYTFARLLIEAISYGIVVALFLQSMYVLLSPVKPIKWGIKWAFIAHTVVIFSFLTIRLGSDLYDEFPPYISILYTEKLDFNTGADGITLTVIFLLSRWLIDGLLLYRCYVIYSMNHWAMAFPCLIYLASVAIGIAYVCWPWGSMVFHAPIVLSRLETSDMSIWILPNVLLTLMIVTRLILHRRNFRKAIGASDRSDGLYAAIVAMLIESCALCSITYILRFVPSPWVGEIFSGTLGSVQVIASYMITVRVANRRALTSDSISGSVDSIRFRSQGSTDGDESLVPDVDLTNTAEVNGEAPSEPGAGTGDAIEGIPL